MNIIAVTACTAGVAHTYMAKKGLQKAAKKLGHEIKVETQGSMGIEGEVKTKDIQKSDVTIFAVDTKVEKSNRFKDCTIHEVAVADAVKNATKVIEDAINKL